MYQSIQIILKRLRHNIIYINTEFTFIQKSVNYFGTFHLKACADILCNNFGTKTVSNARAKST